MFGTRPIYKTWTLKAFQAEELSFGSRLPLDIDPTTPQRTGSSHFAHSSIAIMSYYSYPHQGQSGYEPFPQPPSAPWATPPNEVHMPWQDAMRRYPTPVQSMQYSKYAFRYDARPLQAQYAEAYDADQRSVADYEAAHGPQEGSSTVDPIYDTELPVWHQPVALYGVLGYRTMMLNLLTVIIQILASGYQEPTLPQYPRTDTPQFAIAAHSIEGAAYQMPIPSSEVS